MLCGVPEPTEVGWQESAGVYRVYIARVYVQHRGIYDAGVCTVQDMHSAGLCIARGYVLRRGMYSAGVRIARGIYSDTYTKHA